MSGVLQLLVFADDVKILGENTNIIRKIQKLCWRLVWRLV